jgi:Ankyrin repeats (3 copies)
MRGWTRGNRFAGFGVAVVLFAELGMAVVIVVLASRSRLTSSAPHTVRTGDQCQATPISADLVTAIRNANLQVVRKLLIDGTDVNARDAEGNTPLILASFYANPECVELLAYKGGDVNAANNAGATPLIRAATDYEKTRVLAAAGAKVRCERPISATRR